MRPVNIISDPSQELLVAITNNDFDAVIAALNDGADVNTWQGGNVEEGGNRAAIHLATALPYDPDSRGFDIVQELLNRDVNVNVVTQEGFTPLLLAARSGNEDSLNAILAYGEGELNPASNRFVDVNISTFEMDHTATHLAAIEGHEDIISSLIEAGADYNLPDVNGRSAADLARANGHEDLAVDLERDEDLEDFVAAAPTEPVASNKRPGRSPSPDPDSDAGSLDDIHLPKKGRF